MIKLAVISDLHLGYGVGTEREEDCYENARQAFDIALKEEPNLILLLGDIFHDRIPRPEILGKAIELFSEVNKNFTKKLIVSKTIKDGVASDEKYEVSPLLAIWGTHERRAGEAVNPVHILEKAGLLNALHAESILLEVESDKIGLHGLSGVPDNYARSILQSWNPQLFANFPNIFMIHQSFKELIRGNDENLLTLADLPSGFNLYLLGHIHWNLETTHPSGTPVLIPGSTVKTQLTKYESQKPKGVYVINLTREKGEVKFHNIKTRTFFYNELDINNKKPSDIISEMANIISEDLKKEAYKKPIIKIKLSGKLAEGFSPSDLTFNILYKEYSDRAILSLDKSKVVSTELERSSALINELKENKATLDQLGLSILCKTMKETNVKKVEEILDLLSEGDLVKARELL